MLFERCYATANWTLPSFASVFTGLLPYRHGVIGGDLRKLPDRIRTLPQILGDHGYRREAFAAVPYFRSDFSISRGFEKVHLFTDGPVTARLETYQEQVLEWLRKPPDDPWFLLVHYYDAHHPYGAPEPFDGMYYSGDPRDPSETSLSVVYSERNRLRKRKSEYYRWLQGITDIEYPIAQYAAGVSYVDRAVGGLVDVLRATGALDDTLVVLLADHGEQLTEHDTYFFHNWPYEEGLHVPLIVRLPGGQGRGLRIDADVSLLDVLPTLLELMAIPVEVGGDGESVVNLIRGSRSRDRLFFAEHGSPGDRELVKTVWDAIHRLLLFRVDGLSWS